MDESVREMAVADLLEDMRHLSSSKETFWTGGVPRWA
jgi:hypothetical protein